MSINELITYYRECKSLRECERHFNISAQKARRMLIVAGEYRSPIADKINGLYEQGFPVEAIAESLGILKKTVQIYLPYTKCVYNSDAPTVNATRIRACRERKSTHDG